MLKIPEYILNIPAEKLFDFQLLVGHRLPVW